LTPKAHRAKNRGQRIKDKGSGFRVQERRGDRDQEPGETNQRQLTRKDIKILKIKGRIQNSEIRMGRTDCDSDNDSD